MYCLALTGHTCLVAVDWIKSVYDHADEAHMTMSLSARLSTSCWREHSGGVVLTAVTGIMMGLVVVHADLRIDHDTSVAQEFSL